MSGDIGAYILIAVLAGITYGTRIGGHLLLSRFERIDPKVEAALDAIPIAVMSALIAPIALATGIAETVGIGLSGLVSLRHPMHVAIAVAVPAVALLRAFGL